MKALLLTLTMCLLVLPASAKYSGGSGTAQDPYQIATAADLIALGETPAHYDKHFILTADIDLDPNLPGRKVFDKAVIAHDVKPDDWAFDGTPFRGVLDGRGHVISHLTMRGEDYVGLVGRMSWSATVKNLGVVDVNIAGSGLFVGGLVGDNLQGAVTQCYSTGAVSGGRYVGGLVGLNDWTTGPTVEYHAAVTHCYSTVAVSGGDEVGGLVGTNARSTVEQCYSSGGVTGTGENLGGLVGRNHGGSVIQCYGTGTVAGNGQYIGGLVGQNSRDVLQSFWDMETSGQSTSDGGTGKTTAEMQTAKTFLDAGWDFVGETANGSEDIWKIAEGLGYPRLAWEKYSGGTGELNDPYQIATAADLIALGETPEDYDKHFILTADIDLDPNLPGRKVFDKAVIAAVTDDMADWSQEPPFTGVFDGNGHTVSHLTIMGDSCLGLFGELGNWPVVARVKSLGVVDVRVIGSGANIGGLAGDNYGGTVTHCYSTGTVAGSSGVGGLMGGNLGAVTQCYSAGAVSGSSDVGGLVGLNDMGRLTHCYSSAEVSGGSCVGGLAGTNAGNVTQCYSNGKVTGDGNDVGGLVGNKYYRSLGYLMGVASGCFWDIQTSGQAISAGATGKTTLEMQDIQVYLEAGWDFVGEIKNGASEVWQMPPSGGYPVLAVFSGYAAPQLQGQGTSDQPYLITNALELGAICRYSPFAHYRLGTSIDLEGIRWGVAVIPEFAGSFDGNGHTISHLTIRGGEDLGLFGRLAAEAEVKNLGVLDVNIAASGEYFTGGGQHNTGGLAGGNSGRVLDCHTAGVIRGANNVGGLAGGNDGTISQCASTATVEGVGYQIGGLVGYDSGSVIGSYSSSAVSGNLDVGGLVGAAGKSGVINQCYSAGAVDGHDHVGGLVGGNSGSVTQCYSTGAVSGDWNVGGLVGWNGFEDAGVTRCYSIGAVRGASDVGGLVGSGGGISVTACFWDIQTSVQIGSPGGTGKTTAEMQMAITFLEAGWDFVGETANGTEDIWWILEGKDYPKLWWELNEQKTVNP